MNGGKPKCISTYYLVALLRIVVHWKLDIGVDISICLHLSEWPLGILWNNRYWWLTYRFVYIWMLNLHILAPNDTRFCASRIQDQKWIRQLRNFRLRNMLQRDHAIYTPIYGYNTNSQRDQLSRVFIGLPLLIRGGTGTLFFWFLFLGLSSCTIFV